MFRILYYRHLFDLFQVFGIKPGLYEEVILDGASGHGQAGH